MFIHAFMCIVLYVCVSYCRSTAPSCPRAACSPLGAFLVKYMYIYIYIYIYIGMCNINRYMYTYFYVCVHIHRYIHYISLSIHISPPYTNTIRLSKSLTSLVQSIMKYSEFPCSQNLRVHVSEGACSHDQSVFVVALREKPLCTCMGMGGQYCVPPSEDMRRPFVLPNALIQGETIFWGEETEILRMFISTLKSIIKEKCNRK